MRLPAYGLQQLVEDLLMAHAVSPSCNSLVMALQVTEGATSQPEKRLMQLKSTVVCSGTSLLPCTICTDSLADTAKTALPPKSSRD